MSDVRIARLETQMHSAHELLASNTERLQEQTVAITRLEAVMMTTQEAVAFNSRTLSEHSKEDKENFSAVGKGLDKLRLEYTKTTSRFSVYLNLLLVGLNAVIGAAALGVLYAAVQQLQHLDK